ncbi:MAG: apolipoprotein N-acyltransferase [Candidatus Rokubacteria bacterium]|nr:apolipoprotein N-acyltransferase [Candidatus Rokubacteria bacterium]
MRILLAVLTGLGQFLSYPPAALSPVAFVTLVPLLVALDRAPRRSAFWLGTLAGMLFYPLHLSWMTHAMAVYGGLSWGVSLLILLLLSLYVALYLGMFSVGWVWLRPASALGQVLFAASLWVVLEFVRTYLLTGFPWAFLAYTQSRNLPLIQIASVTGMYGVSFVVVLVNAAIALALRPGRAGAALAPALAASLALLVTLAYGAWTLSRAEPARGFRIAVVQGNIDQGVKWDPAFRGATLATYERLSREAAERGADLVVWPEAAVPFLLRLEPEARARVAGLARETRRYILVGSPDLEGGRFYNSAFLISQDGALLQRYDKIHLVPFGEYVPLRSLLGFIEKLARGAVGDFAPGGQATVFSTPFGRFGVTISYEVYFPAEVRRLVRGGAGFLVNITNDAWYGRSAAPVQHLAMAVFRAVEHRTFLVRSANTGISAIIDPRGRIREQSAIFREAVLVGKIGRQADETIYTRVGDLFAWAATAGSASAGLWGWRRGGVA